VPSGLAVFVPVSSGKGKGLGLRQKESDFSTVTSVAATEVKDSDVSAVLNCHTPEGEVIYEWGTW